MLQEILYPFRQKKTLLQMGICALVFIGMAVPFKVMVLIEGLTEVRPVNAVPVVAGLLFGPAGAWGCAAGNLIADLFGTFSKGSVLGFIGNFVAAYLPYKLWHFFKKGEAPNAKSHVNIVIYVLISAVGAMATAVIIACGLDVFLGVWSRQLFTIVCLNDFLFPLFLGLPVLIVLTCEDNKVSAFMPPARADATVLRGVSLALSVIMSLGITVMVYLGLSMSGSLLMFACGVVLLLSLAGVILL